ncbi:DNA repair protein RecO [Oecophyllibacter saccharovorans]|uniref:DNA repair protein RecO n=1 Tax=Oecophyllibacter saccharovorans TaxID=2558360 RepID=UPI001E407765|nr:DNA repair protein RecO [Oecophyllibacter saccharovorans]
MIEWEAPAVVVNTALQGEGSLLATVLTGGQGLRRGLVYGGQSRRQRGCWELGTIVVARWQARLPDQLGRLSAEPVRFPAASLLSQPLSLALLRSACTLAAETLPEKEPCPEVFEGLVGLLGALTVNPQSPPVADYLRWELILLQTLGYGLSLGACAVTGAQAGLAYVSPKSGCAVTDEGAGPWRARLLPLPGFLTAEAGSLETDGQENEPRQAEGSAQAWLEGLQLTGHFLQRAVFDTFHRPLPAARALLEQRLVRLAQVS